jgi:acyl-CoA thioester hydrolase
MYDFETTIRVRYVDTDKMGFVYYGHYPKFYEIGRVEAMRALGANYKEMEESGIMLPVYSCYSKFLKPALFDDLLIIKTIIKEIPISRISFDYEIYNQKNELINIGNTILVFVDIASNKPCRAPKDFIKKIKPFF